MLDIAHDVGARLEHDFAAANGPFNTPVHDDAVGFYAAIDNFFCGFPEENSPASLAGRLSCGTRLRCDELPSGLC